MFSDNKKCFVILSRTGFVGRTMFASHQERVSFFFSSLFSLNALVKLFILNQTRILGMCYVPGPMIFESAQVLMGHLIHFGVCPKLATTHPA